MKIDKDGLGFLLHDATRLLRKRFEDRGRSHGLSSAQWRLLVRVIKEEGISQARLSGYLEIEPISVSRLVDRMEEAGWIERRQDPTDRRVRMIHPTQKSLEAFSEIREVATTIYDEALTGLSPDDRATVIRGLKTIIANLADDSSQKSAFPESLAS